MPKQKNEIKILVPLGKPTKSNESAKQELKRAERALQLAVHRLKQEGIEDYKIKIWTYK